MRPRTVVGALLLRALLEHPLEAEVLPDLLPGVVQDLAGDVDEDRLVPRLGEVLAHSGTHHTGADDADLLDLHVRLPFCPRPARERGRMLAHPALTVLQDAPGGTGGEDEAGTIPANVCRTAAGPATRLCR